MFVAWKKFVGGCTMDEFEEQKIIKKWCEAGGSTESYEGSEEQKIMEDWRKACSARLESKKDKTMDKDLKDYLDKKFDCIDAEFTNLFDTLDRKVAVLGMRVDHLEKLATKLLEYADARLRYKTLPVTGDADST
jgi:hypothetical protein